MSFHDRDWYRDTRPSARRSPPSKPFPVGTVLLAAIVIASIALALHRHPEWRQRLAPHAALAPSAVTPPAEPAQRLQATPQPEALHERRTAMPSPEAHWRPPAPSTQTTPAQDNPMVKPGTIYLCRSYNGQSFWSQAHCQTHRALIERIASVPPTLPFDQQVRLAQGEADAVHASVQAEKDRIARDSRCGALQAERDRIWSRYSGGQYQPPEVVGPDQTRWRQLDRELNSLGCVRR